ncbi:MAG: hypothetical protein DMF64_14810 [Acidobacteria bacterium]|nr:MAG: hypothetical protein DMF64_14810 [Acidobacteriota bacterium]
MHAHKTDATRAPFALKVWSHLNVEGDNSPPPETSAGSKSAFVSERRQGKQRALWHSLAVAG